MIFVIEMIVKHRECYKHCARRGAPMRIRTGCLTILIYLLAGSPVFTQQSDIMLEGEDPVPQDAVEFILDAFDRYSVVCLGDYLSNNLRVQLDHEYPGDVLSITTHTDLEKIETLFPEMLSWPRGSIAVLEGTKPGSIPHGPLKLQDFYDAILYLGPIRSISTSSIVYEMVSDEAYFTEVVRFED